MKFGFCTRAINSRTKDATNTPGIVFDHQWPRDMKNKEFMLRKYKEAEEHVIHFSEGDGPRMSGMFSLVHFRI